MTMDQEKQMFELELGQRLARAEEQLATRLNGAGWLAGPETAREALRKAEYLSYRYGK